QENLEVIPHHEATQNIHVGGSRPLQASNNGSTVEEATERGIGFAENNVVVGNNENAKRSVELPFFLTAAIAYILVGFWMLKAMMNSRVPYIIATTISLILIGPYTVSHTVGFPLVGLEHVGVLDLLVTALQIGIVGCSGYVIL